MTQSKEIKEANRRQRKSLVLVCHPLFLFVLACPQAISILALISSTGWTILRDGETVDGQNHQSRGEGHHVSNLHDAPHVHNQSHQSRGERQSRSSKHRKLEKEQPVHLLQ